MSDREKWLLRLNIVEGLSALWILLSQFLILKMGMHADVLPSSLALLLLAIPLALANSKRSRPVLWALLLMEAACLGAATVTGKVAGFHLIVLTAAARAGLLLPPLPWLGFCLLLCAEYIFLVDLNPQIIIQSATEFNSSQGLLGIIFGRDFLVFFAGVLLVGGLIWSILAEADHRSALEALSLRLEELAAEEERTRILTEISSSVDHLLFKVHQEVDEVLNAVEEPGGEQKLEQARNLAAEALTEIRRGLKLLRDE